MNTATRKELNISEIEALTEDEAAAFAEDRAEIKEHTVYFIDIPGYFGYSALVYKDGHHIYYANDYELHHRRSSDKPSGKTHEELRAIYEEKLNRILYTEDEISAPLQTYQEYDAKQYFLRNYYAMRREHLSIFGATTPENKAEFERRRRNMVYDPVALAYLDDPAFVEHHISLWNTLETRYAETKENYDFQKSAFYYELGNHEYHINTYQGDWDTLSAFGSIPWHGQGAEARALYYDELGFNETQRRAFEDARREFLRDAIKNDWY